MKNNTRDRLIDLLEQAEGQVNNDVPSLEMIADYLIAKGVTIPPCKVGDSIFYLHRNSQGNNSIFKANVLGVVVAIYDDTKKFYLKIIYEDADGYTDRATAIYGVNAFSSLEEAELKLKELSK